MEKYIVGITGASGSVIAKLLLEYLAGRECELNVIVTENGKAVFRYETEIGVEDFVASISQNTARVVLHGDNDLFAPVASGSYGADCMLIAPCSMASAGKIANGTGGGLLVRAADVCLKEKARLIISPRETPLNAIHIKNLLTLCECGAVVVPPMPMFYAKDETVAEVYAGIAGRILKSAGIENNLYKKWRT